MSDTTSADDGAEIPVVLITGGAGGMGVAAARRFVAGGWRVVVADHDQIRAEALADELGEVALAVHCDVTRPESCHAAVRATLAWAGRLDHTIAAAGLWTEGPIDDVDEFEFDRVMAVNVKGVFFTSKAAVPALRVTRGSLTLIASDAGLQANKGASVYCASKGAVVLLAKTLALDLAPDGVRVNAVCPGDVMTPMLRYQAEAYGGTDQDGYLAELLSKYPQGTNARFIEPAEVAELMWFLAQPTSAPITGAAMSIDFGLSSGIQ
ncbi:MAG: putative short-chain dehydrogenase [Ilumatobacteraceae bacterium]|nr:putative short-chain dehydrogenase [Ilumatobacteraceae bacterium]